MWPSENTALMISQKKRNNVSWRNASQMTGQDTQTHPSPSWKSPIESQTFSVRQFTQPQQDNTKRHLFHVVLSGPDGLQVLRNHSGDADGYFPQFSFCQAWEECVLCRHATLAQSIVCMCKTAGCFFLLLFPTDVMLPLCVALRL